MGEQTALFQLRNISKVFRSTDLEVRAVDDISLDIFPGEIFGIIGMSGAGKSTLVRTLNRLEDVTSGQVIFDGQVLGDLSNKELRAARRSMAMIFQSFNLLMQKTVLANVMLPKIEYILNELDFVKIIANSDYIQFINRTTIGGSPLILYSRTEEEPDLWFSNAEKIMDNWYYWIS